MNADNNLFLRSSAAWILSEVLQFAILVAERHARRLSAEAGSCTLKRAPRGRKLFKELLGRCTSTLWCTRRARLYHLPVYREVL